MIRKFRWKDLDEMQRNVLVFLSFNTLAYVATSVFGPFLTAHYASLGISNLQIGILTAIGPLSAMVIQPTWALISDKSGSRVGVLKVAVLGATLCVLLYMLGTNFWSLAIITFLYVSFQSPILPMGDAITVNYLQRTPYRYSFVRMGGTLGFALCTVLSGLFIRKNPNLSFALGAIFFFLLFITVCRMPKVQQDSVKREKKKLDFGSLFRNKKILFVLFMACSIQVALSCYNSFLGVYIRDMGLGSAHIGLASMTSALSEVPILLTIDKVMRRVSIKKILLFSGFMTTVRLLLLAGASNMGMIIIAQLFQSFSYMTVHYSSITFINQEVEEDLKTSGQMLLALVQGGLGSILGNILGGYLSGIIGMNSTFFIYAGFVFSVTVICTLFVFVSEWKQKQKSV